MFAMSSISEGYSIALLEACACALPIAATRGGGNAGIVADDVNSLVVPPSDPAALSAANGQLLGDPGRPTAIGAAAPPWAFLYPQVYAKATAYPAAAPARSEMWCVGA